ncbi:MAG: hypothetical protein PHD95_06720 [Candidatus ainarchaeum sp.]|nr:hypothetical protein [Candidatus ainarchaeum sp.]
MLRKKPFLKKKPHCKSFGFAMHRKSFAFTMWEKKTCCASLAFGKSRGKMLRKKPFEALADARFRKPWENASQKAFRSTG